MMKKITLSLALASTLILSGHASAQSCKGMSESSCSSNSNSCYWVKGYKRSDGVQVKAHCRTKAKKKSLSDAAKTSSKTAKSSTEKAKVSSTKTSATQSVEKATKSSSKVSSQKSTASEKAKKKVESTTKKSS